MKKRLILNILAAVLLIASLAPGAFALEARHIADGTCGDGITWSLDGYTLTIDGSGPMDDGAPWSEHKDHIEHVVLTGGVTKVGKDAFYQYDRIETVDFGDSLVEIGDGAFLGCEDIDYIHLPDTFKKFGAQCFKGCTSLKYVYCDGGMPRFGSSCLWSGGYISVFYPTNNPWPAESVNQLVHNFGGSLGIMMGNFEDSAVAELLGDSAEDETEETEETEPEQTETEETEATEETQAATEAAVVSVTEPETEPTEATTEPETEPATVPTEAPTETTVPKTEETTVPTTEETEAPAVTFETAPPEPEEPAKSSSWIGIVLIAGVLTFLILGALIFRIASRRGRYR